MFVFRWIAGRMRCLGGKHERSQKHAVKADGDDKYTSRCMYCGVSMIRRAKRDWIVAPKR
ncbi:MAG: hypothetical protein KF730_01410 [Sphingomonas sp.]|uniref:hypothetical protein n=1 Tax=Sphingomonas sp. TaxID=28214 RepID=UPI0025FFC442|nr:hypothetical protein [Sphingomonas sp.]MBX3563210.1 hypothetical protein [Sphingomonas sp.]